MPKMLFMILLSSSGVLFYPSFLPARHAVWADYPNYRIVVNIPATELRLYEGKEIVRTFPVAVGRLDFPTPAKWEDSLGQIIWNPWWYPPDSEWAKEEEKTPPGPENPLGVVKLPLSDALLMHGTNEERSIGTAASHACIRLKNEDAKTLAWILQSELTPHFDPSWLMTYSRHRKQTFWVKLPKEIPVRFIYEPMEFKAGQVFLYPDLYGKIGNKKARLIEKLNVDGAVAEVLASQWQKARRQHLQLDLALLQSRTKTEPAPRSGPAWLSLLSAPRHGSWWPDGKPAIPPLRGFQPK